MNSEILAVLDDIAARLARPVMIEDTCHRVMAYSNHGPDDVSRESILCRCVPPQIVTVLDDLGVYRARRAVAVPPCAQRRMRARLCVPIRHRNLSLGMLWFVNANPPMTDEEVASAEEAAALLAPELYRQDVLAGRHWHREEEAMDDLLADDAWRRAHGARLMLERARVTSGGGVRAITVLPILDDDHKPDTCACIGSITTMEFSWSSTDHRHNIHRMPSARPTCTTPSPQP